MWIFTKHGFYSAVCARKGNGEYGQPGDPDCIMVRSRLTEHLENLKNRFPKLLGECEIKEFKGSDYACRIFVPKNVWAQVAEQLADETDYDNFKSEVARLLGTSGRKYERLLHEVWSVMYQLQTGKKGGASRTRNFDWKDVAECIQRFDSDRELLTSDGYGDGGTMMLFPRLERAALNQFEDGESTVSRYAIWANTVRDHIRAAMEAPDDERRRLLTHASNSLSAFSQVQSLFDPRS